MRRKFFLSTFSLLLFHFLMAQAEKSPDKIYGRLFSEVQMSRIFPTSKTFADCIPKRDPEAIVNDYLSIINNPAVRFSLKLFVEENFTLPDTTINFQKVEEEDIKTYINRLLDSLKHPADTISENSSLVTLPNPYMLPGLGYREMRYWNSYFIMLGLQENNNYEQIEDMINNCSYLLSQYDHIPHGNRTYYLSRSQPPFFSLMLDLLSERKGGMIYALYQNALQKEYDYWMDKLRPTKHVAVMPDGSRLNRYYDESEGPRAEFFYEDSSLAENYKGNSRMLYRNLRAASESGWNFSSRWLSEEPDISAIQTINLVPIDLNCLLYHLEITLAKSYKETGNLLQVSYYNQVAETRKRAINKYCFNRAENWYYDYDLSQKSIRKDKTLAGVAALFLNVAVESSAKEIAGVLQRDFLKQGGLVTTLKNSGQWDAPYGWAPLEYMAIKGLENYDMKALAKDVATRWVQLNMKVYNETGKILEKYNVVNGSAETDDKKYTRPERNGWTAAVLLKLMNDYEINE